MFTAMVAMVLVPQVIRLWSGDAPGALGKTDDDVPTITVYRPERPCGTAIVVCPGGGYGGLADHEGAGYAQYLNRFGITAAVLKYRLGSHGYHHPAMLNDAERAIRLVRVHAAEWGVDRNKVGVMGSSAGGHLASTLLTHWHRTRPEASDDVDGQSSRPDFGILCYPVITMGPQTHEGSKENLLGKSPEPALVDSLSNEKQVDAQTPPTFIWTTADDNVVPAANSLMFASALSTAGVSYELHIYPHGAHGLGLGGSPDSDRLLPWTTELVRWLRDNGWAPK